MKGIAFTGGQSPRTEICRELAKDAEIIGAADSGLITCEDAGIVPHIIAGDFDSIDNMQRLLKYPADIVYRYNKDKDQTDTEIIICLLFERGCENITLVGGGGGRTDHLLAIYKIFERKKSPQRWVTANEDIYKITKNICIELRQNTLVSFFPLEKNCKAESSGLKWNLNNVDWSNSTIGISNVVLNNKIKIDVKCGSFLLVINNAEE
ncbi:MAG: thiamine diphosphokinase [Spirochaetaceae bacterium]|jgi:thiamine pyrophosphokinase|nr:thiamine diphosphokinase [Spirochaetaceae bacterium]